LDKKDFEPPKLPIVWIASTFVAPILIVVLPLVFSANVSFSVLLIIALSLLSLLLLIVCFALVVRIYSEAYKTQIATFHLDRLEKEVLSLQSRLDVLEKAQHQNRD
jgi:hypothetical protein